jgi:hypothetical protein
LHKCTVRTGYSLQRFTMSNHKYHSFKFKLLFTI